MNLYNIFQKSMVRILANLLNRLCKLYYLFYIQHIHFDTKVKNFNLIFGSLLIEKIHQVSNFDK